LCATWRAMPGPCGTPLVFVFVFNREGLKQKVLQSAGTNAKQKKAQESKSKLGESARTKHTFKPNNNNI